MTLEIRLEVTNLSDQSNKSDNITINAVITEIGLKLAIELAASLKLCHGVIINHYVL